MAILIIIIEAKILNFFVSRFVTLFCNNSTCLNFQLRKIIVLTILITFFKLKRINYLFYIFTALCSTSAYAENDYIHEIDLYEDVQTVTSATRLKQKITDAPVSVTIIDSKMIEASGATEVHELLRLVPGFFSYSIWGNHYAVSNHFQPTDVGIRLEVQVNGRSVYEPFFTAVDWPSLGIDVADIDYIEIIRGSSATAHGSNAFLGAVNIITKSALSRPKASIRTRLGNIGRKELTLNKSGNIKDVNYAFSLVHKSNTGFPALEEPQRLRDLTNDDRDSLNVSIQGNYIPNLNSELKFEVGFGRTNIEIPFSSDIRGFTKREHKSNFQKLKWITKDSSTERSLQFFHSYLSLNDDFNAGLLSDIFGITPQEVSILFPGQQDQLMRQGLQGTHSQRYDIEFEQTGKVSQASYVWGFGARKNQVRSPAFIGNGTKSENRFRLFGNIDWKINKKTNTNLGVLAERSDNNNWVLSPRVALNFHPVKNHTFRTSITKGKLIPSVTFQNINTAFRFNDGSIIDVRTISNKNMKVEKVTAFEVAYIASIPNINTQLDIKLFREEMKDLLGLQIRPFNDLDQQIRVWDNTINVTTKGLELQATHKFKHFIPDLNARLAYAYLDTDGTKLHDTREPITTREASAIPRHSATLLLSKKLNNQIDVSSIFQYQSDFLDRNVKIKRVDFKVSKSLKLARTSGTASLVVQNALNTYSDFSARNQFKTRAFLQLELDF